MAEATTPHDLETALRRIELLRLENQMLRAHLAGRGEGERIAAAGDVVVDAAVYDRLTLAEKDLRWVLHRLGSGPLGALLRRRSGFRRLEEEWLR